MYDKTKKVKKTEAATASLRRLNTSLNEDFDSHKKSWREVQEFMLPNKGRFLSGYNSSETNNGKRKTRSIINNTASDAVRTIAAGLQGGLTSPSRPWFTLSLADKQLMEHGPVKHYLSVVRRVLLDIFSRSNFYGAIHNVYQEVAGFGTGSMLLLEDMNTVLRCRPFTAGEFKLLLDKSYRPNGLMRDMDLTAYQMVQQFGINNVSDPVKEAYNRDDFKSRFHVVHGITPNDMRDYKAGGPKNMAYKSCYYEEKGDPEKFLKVSGFKSMPFIASRWDVTGTDTYGNCPGIDSVGDVKMLQKMEELKLKGLDKVVNPPMNAPATMRNNGGTIIAGGINYVDGGSGTDAFRPAYQINPGTNHISAEIREVEQRIKRSFFNDLFLSIISADRGMTATEVAKRHEEKLIMLGPVLERIQTEVLDLIIERTFSLANELGVLPEPPKELQGMEFKIEYISMLAQAQKLVGITSIEQTANFVGNLAGLYPEVRDKFNADEAVEEYAEAVGIDPKIIRTEDEVAGLRQQAAAEQQEMKQMEQAKQMIDGAKSLSDINVGDGNAIEKAMGM